MSSVDRPVDRRRRSREPARPGLGHVEAILETDSELAGNVDARLVGEAHARRQRRRLAVDEIDRLVAVEADAVAGAVRRARQFVARAVAPRLVLAAHSIVDASGGRADPSRFEGDLLAAMDLVPDFALFGAWLAEDERARDVRLVALDRAAAVHQHHL